MNPYYTANTIFVVLAMMIMLAAVSFNTTLDQQRKNITRALFLVISTAALCEWLGNVLDGAPAESIGLHKLVKYVELCSAPYLGLLCGKSLSSRVLWEKGIRCLLAFHVMLETVSLFTGQIWYVDAQNIYHHGPLYIVYIAFYCFSTVYYLVQGLQTFRRYQQSGSVMVLLLTVFLASGIAVTLYDNNVEIIWLVVAISAIMLYKFYGDILQQVDGLTELGNRWSFEDHLKRYRGTGVILFFDVDHFKLINDTFGHAVGDKCLCTVAQGLREVYGDNIYAIPLTRRRGLTLHGGAGLNILNTEALRHYEEEGLASVTASFELSMRGIKSLGGSIPLGAIVYGRLPLMHFRNCPLRAQIGCAACRARGELTDRRGVKFPVECGEKKYSTLLNSVPLHIADKDLRGLDHCILWFTRESAAECAAVAADYRAGRKSERERTGGLYYRELL